MVHISLKPVKAGEKIFNFLERKNLISVLKPTEKALKTKKKNGAVDVLYTSRKSFGGHRLMCIGKKNTKVQLCWHSDNEDLFFLNPLNMDYRKLYLIFALDKLDVFNKKFLKNNLKDKDFIAVEVSYNNPNLSFFSILKKTVHCEIIESKIESEIKKQHPVFFVSESSELKNNKIKHKNLNIIVDGE